jgi:hypothetical protein
MSTSMPRGPAADSTLQTSAVCNQPCCLCKLTACKQHHPHHSLHCTYSMQFKYYTVLQPCQFGTVSQRLIALDRL